MLKRKNVSKKKLWGFSTFNTTKSHQDRIEIYEEIFNLNLDISQLLDKVSGVVSSEEKIKMMKEIEFKKNDLQILEKKLLT